MSDALPVYRPAPEDKLLTASDLSEWLGVSASWVRAHSTTSEPRLPALKLGKLLRYRVADIKRFLREQGIRA